MSRADTVVPTTLLLAVLVAGCGPDVEPRFEGGRVLQLDCIEERRPPTDEEIGTLVDALLEAYGGRERLRDLSFHRVEDVYLRRAGTALRSNRATRQTWFRSSGRVRVEHEYLDGVEIRVLNEDGCFMSGRNGPMKAIGDDRAQNVWYDFEVLALPALLEREGVRVGGRAPREEDGRVLVGLDIDTGRPPVVTAWIDPNGPVVDMVEAELPLTGDLAVDPSAVSRQVFRDHRRLEGILVPRRRELWVRSSRAGAFDRYGVSDLNSNEFGEIDDAVFHVVVDDVPGDGSAVVDPERTP